MSYPLSFYATQIICHFLNSRISAKYDEVEGFCQFWNPYNWDWFSIVESLLIILLIRDSTCQNYYKVLWVNCMMGWISSYFVHM